MFSLDFQRAQEAETERARIASLFLIMPKPVVEQKVRDHFGRCIKNLPARILLLAIRINHASKLPDVKKWLAPTEAEKCVMKCQ